MNALTKTKETAMITCKTQVNRQSSATVFEVVVPDGPNFWKIVGTFRTQEEADRFQHELSHRGYVVRCDDTFRTLYATTDYQAAKAVAANGNRSIIYANR